MKKIVAVIVLLLVQAWAWADDGQSFFETVDALPPQEQFRQLSLMMLVSDGADEHLISALTGMSDETGGNGTAGINFDDYTTPLIRIVDQQSMLAGASQLFLFTRENAIGISERLQALQNNTNVPFDSNTINEDAIIIRNAIADSMDYTFAPGGPAPGETLLSDGYRNRTTYLRNNLEYSLFAADLDRITREAVESVIGRTEAFERMFDDEVDSTSIDKKIRAAEYAYGWDRDFDEKAAEMAQKMLDSIAEDQSVPKTKNP